MANISVAVTMVVDYIVTNNLYSFESLTEETQQKLINAYGKYIGHHVNARLPL